MIACRSCSTGSQSERAPAAFLAASCLRFAEPAGWWNRLPALTRTHSWLHARECLVPPDRHIEEDVPDDELSRIGPAAEPAPPAPPGCGQRKYAQGWIAWRTRRLHHSLTVSDAGRAGRLRVERALCPFEALLWMMECLTMTLATHVIFVRRSLAKEANRRRLFPSKKSWLIGSGSSNGVDSVAVVTRASAVDCDALRIRLGLNLGDFVVDYVGRVTHDEGVDTLIEAILDDGVDTRVRFLVIGPVEDVALHSRIEQLGDRASTSGWTDSVWGHLPGLNVVSLPTMREDSRTSCLKRPLPAPPQLQRGRG